MGDRLLRPSREHRDREAVAIHREGCLIDLPLPCRRCCEAQQGRCQQRAGSDSDSEQAATMVSCPPVPAGSVLPKTASQLLLAMVGDSVLNLHR